MIADALKVEIERYALEMIHRNALYVGAAEGRITAEKAAYYLSNVRCLLRHVIPYLESARSRAIALGDHALAEHYAQKWREEHGHDRWADDDLARLHQERATSVPAQPAPGLLALLRFLEATIERDPACFLSYILFGEYLIALMGAQWLALIEERCGIAASNFSVIAKHAELDRDHTEEGLEAIDRLVPDPRKLASMRAVLRQILAYFDQLSAEVMAFGEAGVCATSSAA